MLKVCVVAQIDQTEKPQTYVVIFCLYLSFIILSKPAQYGFSFILFILIFTSWPHLDFTHHRYHMMANKLQCSIFEDHVNDLNQGCQVEHIIQMYSILQIYTRNLKCVPRLICFTWKDWEKQENIFISVIVEVGNFVKPGNPLYKCTQAVI